MEDIFSADINVLVLNDLTLSQYYFLKFLFDNPSSSEIGGFGVCADANIDDLQDKGFVKILLEQTVLREKGRELFIKDIDNFFRFVNAFPIKTPKGRYLSPKSLEGIAITKIKNKWKNLFKGNHHMEDKVIRILEAEVEWRRNKPGELEYMNAIEAWLNGALWEKYEHLIEEKQQQIESDYSQFM